MCLSHAAVYVSLPCSLGFTLDTYSALPSGSHSLRLRLTCRKPPTEFLRRVTVLSVLEFPCDSFRSFRFTAEILYLIYFLKPVHRNCSEVRVWVSRYSVSRRHVSIVCVFIFICGRLSVFKSGYLCWVLDTVIANRRDNSRLSVVGLSSREGVCSPAARISVSGRPNAPSVNLAESKLGLCKGRLRSLTTGAPSGEPGMLASSLLCGGLTAKAPFSFSGRQPIPQFVKPSVGPLW